MNAMKSFFQDCLKLPYQSNSQDNPLHENQVEELLIKHGLEYKAQPNGIQNSPDFLVTYNGKDIPIECKSSKGHFPMYNGGLPKVGVVYIFSSKKYNETTVYRSEDVVSDTKRKAFQNLIEDVNSVLESHRQTEEWKEDDRGFDFYIRNMFIQKGGGNLVDYFKHDKRSLCEENVLNGDY